MIVPVTMDEVERRTAPRSRFAGGQVAKVLARLGSPAYDVDGIRLEREVHEALVQLRTQSREQARGASRSAERSRASRHAARRDQLNGSNVTAAGRPGRIRPRRQRGMSLTR
jgi:phage tail tape-measure protein